MKAHPIIDYPYRWIPILLLLLVLVAAQVALVCLYTGADYLPALVDGIATMGWLAALAYLAWYVVGLVSLLQTDIIMIVVGSLLWLAVGRIKENDDNGNVVNGNVVTVNTQNCVIEGAEKLIATVGLRDMIVVDTKDATRISTKENAGEIKKVLAKLREEGKTQYL